MGSKKQVQRVLLKHYFRILSLPLIVRHSERNGGGNSLLFKVSSESHGERVWNFQVGSIPLHEEESGRASHFGPEEMQHKECGREKNASQCSMLWSPWLSKGNFLIETFK